MKISQETRKNQLKHEKLYFYGKFLHKVRKSFWCHEPGVSSFIQVCLAPITLVGRVARCIEAALWLAGVALLRGVALLGRVALGLPGVGLGLPGEALGLGWVAGLRVAGLAHPRLAHPRLAHPWLAHPAHPGLGLQVGVIGDALEEGGCSREFHDAVHLAGEGQGEDDPGVGGGEQGGAEDDAGLGRWPGGGRRPPCP